MITDELREYASTRISPNKQMLFDIADRIDIAHKHAVGYVDDRDPETMAENGWIRLPKDADGEYVHVGDVMVYADGNTCPMKVVALVPPYVFLTEDGPRYADMCRHKPPTVEDVLQEMLDKSHIWDGLEAAMLPDLIAEYAAKLQLKEDV